MTTQAGDSMLWPHRPSIDASMRRADWSTPAQPPKLCAGVGDVTVALALEVAKGLDQPCTAEVGGRAEGEPEAMGLSSTLAEPHKSERLSLPHNCSPFLGEVRARARTGISLGHPRRVAPLRTADGATVSLPSPSTRAPIGLGAWATTAAYLGTVIRGCRLAVAVSVCRDTGCIRQWEANAIRVDLGRRLVIRSCRDDRGTRLARVIAIVADDLGSWTRARADVRVPAETVPV